MKNPDENWEDYVYRNQREHGTYAMLKGIEPFRELFLKGIIKPHSTAIRIMYSGSVDRIYFVNQKGELIQDQFDLDCVGVDPEKILSIKECLYWWEVEGIKPKGFDERNRDK